VESEGPDHNQPISLDAARQRAGLARLRAGDQAALGEIVAEYWERIVRYANRLLDDLDAAHDVAQTTFTRLWQLRSEIPSGVSLATFIYRTARSYAIDEYRRVDTQRRGRLAIWQAGARGPSTPLEHTERAEVTNAIDRALARLPARRREAFVLFHFHNLSYNQIADLMGVRPQVVANYMSAALTGLRAELSSSISDYLDRT
jgi:RNA polymerase sigma-70 factor (ECF subfamily)